MPRRLLFIAGILAASCAFSALLLRVGRSNESPRFMFFALAVIAFIFLSALAVLPAALYFRGSEVTERLRMYIHHPTRPAVIIYDWNQFDGPGGTYAFDGETFRTLRLTPLYGIPVDPDGQWSPDKTRLVMNVDGLYLFDVARWRVWHLTGQGVPPSELHSERLAGWSPGSRRFAVIDPGKPPFPNQQPALLTEWDAETVMARTVGCTRDTPDHGAWESTDFAWQADVLVITATGPQDARCAAIPQ